MVTLISWWLEYKLAVHFISIQELKKEFKLPENMCLLLTGASDLITTQEVSLEECSKYNCLRVAFSMSLKKYVLHFAPVSPACKECIPTSVCSSGTEVMCPVQGLPFVLGTHVRGRKGESHLMLPPQIPQISTAGRGTVFRAPTWSTCVVVGFPLWTQQRIIL